MREAAAVPPLPGNPHLTQPQDEWIATKPRDKGPPLPEGFGRSEPDSPVVPPVDAGDAGSTPAEVVAELKADLAARPEAVTWAEQAKADGFRGIGDPWPD